MKKKNKRSKIQQNGFFYFLIAERNSKKRERERERERAEESKREKFLSDEKSASSFEISINKLVRKHFFLTRKS